MICKSCGAENAEGSAFCATCGTSLEEKNEAVAVQQPETEAPAAEAPAAEAPAAEVPAAEVPVSEAPAKPSKVMGIVSTVLGALSLLGNASCTCMCGCLGGFPAIVMGIVGLVLSIMAMVKAKNAGTKDTLAIVGLVLSILSLLLCLLVCIVNAVIGGASALMESLQGGKRY